MGQQNGKMLGRGARDICSSSALTPNWGYPGRTLWGLLSGGTLPFTHPRGSLPARGQDWGWPGAGSRSCCPPPPGAGGG